MICSGNPKADRSTCQTSGIWIVESKHGSAFGLYRCLAFVQAFLKIRLHDLPQPKTFPT
jgi:hypothetical protein